MARPDTSTSGTHSISAASVEAPAVAAGHRVHTAATWPLASASGYVDDGRCGPAPALNEMERGSAASGITDNSPTSPRRALLDDAFVRAALGDHGGQVLIWDAEISGFCLRIHPSGAKAFCVKYVSRAQARWYTIGIPGQPWTADEARRRALDVLMAVACGKDPATEKQDAKRELTVGALIDRYLIEGPLTKIDKRASSWSSDGSNLNRHIRPLMGGRSVQDISRTDMVKAARAIIDGDTAVTVHTKTRGSARVRGGLGAARRTIQTAAAMFAWAIDQEMVTNNPAKGVRLPRASVTERFLTRAEAGHLLSVLGAMRESGRVNPRFAAAIRLLIFTGARKTEILALRWAEIDWPGRRIVLAPDRSKTGGKVGVRRIPLSDAALEVLSAMPRNDGFVFPGGRRSSTYAKGLQKVWCEVRSEAGFPGLRVHDLRHSFASLALANNENLFLISKVLGHTSTRMTERYLHTNDADLQALVQRTTCQWMATAMSVDTDPA